MVLSVPNYIITIENPRGCSRTRFSPKYEVPLIEASFAESAPGGKNPVITCKAMPQPGSKAAQDPETGRDRYAGLRVTRVASLAAEKKRLQHFYGVDKVKQINIFTHTYPVDGFEIQAKRMYPEIFGKVGDKFEVAVEEPTPDEVVEEKDVDVDAPDDIIDELVQLKYVGPKTAAALFAAGFTSIEEISQTDPLDIETVKGVSAKEAQGIVDHAVELSSDSDDIADITE